MSSHTSKNEIYQKDEDMMKRNPLPLLVRLLSDLVSGNWNGGSSKKQNIHIIQIPFLGI